MYKKSRQLIQTVIFGSEEKKLRRIFIEVPGYLYYYEPFEQNFFVHRKVVFNSAERVYYMTSSWTVAEPRTGLSVDSRGEPLLGCVNRPQALPLRSVFRTPVRKP